MVNPDDISIGTLNLLSLMAIVYRGAQGLQRLAVFFHAARVRSAAQVHTGVSYPHRVVQALISV